jgi:hypothetical protein
MLPLEEHSLYEEDKLLLPPGAVFGSLLRAMEIVNKIFSSCVPPPHNMMEIFVC